MKEAYFAKETRKMALCDEDNDAVSSEMAKS